MKRYSNLFRHLKALVYLVLVLALPACEIDEFDDPNNPTIKTDDATIADLNNLVVGTEAGMRNIIGTYYDNVGVIGREHYRFSGADPRFTSDLLGAGNAVLDNNTFYTTNPWSARYRVVQNTNILIEATNNANPELVSEELKQGYLGFAKTIQAHELLMNLNMMNENGIRLDVADFNNLGPIVDREASLAAIAGLLEEAKGHLEAAGATFAFTLSGGFAGFNTPATFLQFNRALAARVAVYRNQFAEALTFLEGSFLDLNGDFNKGVYYVFSTASGDQLNTLYFAPNATGEVRIAQPDFIKDAEPGDDRLSKVSKRTAPATQSGLTGDYDVALYKTNTDPVPIIRNEELILIYAEAKIQTNQLPDAVTALNRIRTGHGLRPYTGALTRDALINEMLRQRRYSLYFEGHRWIDMRRYNKLNELPIDRAGDDVWVNFPIPFAEEGI
ncbi:RagB/SusD family nutrient uptake outer membrane protein [Pontibacter ruber]|uniref:RagB/SusD family nutrient uptake outer membrane protein n=1 Tax=Pontibacter ruber TaxID=1343895 RepID=A0ABW5CVL4_9BACT|nr:RagB/SusD family nutrient uptake outer membrane protein [Pontibacter ruber]